MCIYVTQCTIYYWWQNVCVHCKTPEAVLTHPSIHMKTTFADVEPNPAIVCVVGPAAVVTFPFNSRQAAVGGAVLAPGSGVLARAPCPSYNPNPNTSIEFPLWVSLAWYFVHCDHHDHCDQGFTKLLALLANKLKSHGQILTKTTYN